MQVSKSLDTMTYLISTARSELALYGTGGKHIILKVVYLNQGRSVDTGDHEKGEASKEN